MSLITTNINYCGKEVTTEILMKIFSDTLFKSKFGARQIQAIKSKYFYFDISNSFEFSAYECCPAVLPGNITLNQRDRDLCQFMMTGSLCHKDLIGTAREWMYRQGMNAESIFDDSIFVSAMTENIIKTAAFQLDRIILNGNTAGGTGTYLDLCDGLITKWTADPNTHLVTSVPANITPSGIVAELNKLIDAISNPLTGNPEILYNPSKPLKFGVSQDIAIAYQQFLASNAFMNPNNVDISLNYMGIEMVVLSGLLPATMFLTFADNIILVTDDMGDFDQLIFRDQSLSRICDEVQMKLQGRIGVDYGYAEYVVLYS